MDSDFGDLITLVYREIVVIQIKLCGVGNMRVIILAEKYVKYNSIFIE